MRANQNTNTRQFKAVISSKDKILTTLTGRTITVLNNRTSVRLEPEMWNSLYDIAKREQCTIHDICTLISLRKNPCTSLTAGIRVFLMLYYRAATTEEGHKRAGHGSFELMKERAGLKDISMGGTAPKSSRIMRRGF